HKCSSDSCLYCTHRDLRHSSDAPVTNGPFLFFVLTLRPPPTPTLFPYTTLFRSVNGRRSSSGSLPRDARRICRTVNTARASTPIPKDTRGAVREVPSTIELIEASP